MPRLSLEDSITFVLSLPKFMVSLILASQKISVKKVFVKLAFILLNYQLFLHKIIITNVS